MQSSEENSTQNVIMLDAVVNMLRTSTACAGNIAAEVIAAKLGGELNTERYYA